MFLDNVVPEISLETKVTEATSVDPRIFSTKTPGYAGLKMVMVSSSFMFSGLENTLFSNLNFGGCGGLENWLERWVENNPTFRSDKFP